jgi:hypothetical protein
MNSRKCNIYGEGMRRVVRGGSKQNLKMKCLNYRNCRGALRKNKERTIQVQVINI